MASRIPSVPGLCPTLMVQGTSSSVGKSLFVAGLCRFFYRLGVKVAPFKAQNMALNSAVTPDGFEIGRAQAVQAEAAGVTACVHMNPILLKPETHQRSQVVLLGKPIGSMTFGAYHERKPEFFEIVADSLQRLRQNYQLVILEGAGSPAEVNLKERDLVNMRMAKLAEAPVLLVGDIDRGGVFAALVGTLALLEPEECERVAALVINKFRGDLALLAPGLQFLTGRTGKPVLGVLPYLDRLRIADEDSLGLEGRKPNVSYTPGKLEIAVIKLPHLSNYDDFLPLEHEADICLNFIDDPVLAQRADLVIIPGSKSTVEDLQWLRMSGFVDLLLARAQSKAPILGICAGCQMLGQRILDPWNVESSSHEVEGLRLLDIETQFGAEKTTRVVRFRAFMSSFLMQTAIPHWCEGYEIHMGQVTRLQEQSPVFVLASDDSGIVPQFDGAISANGMVVGTLIHGIFQNLEVRKELLNSLQVRKAHSSTKRLSSPTTPDEYDRLGQWISAHLNLELLMQLAQTSGRKVTPFPGVGQ